MAEAAIDRPGRRHPYPVAAGAEIAGERGDQAEPDPGPADLEITRGAAGAAQRRHQLEALGEPLLHRVEREIVKAAILADLAHRHGLDQGQIVALRCAPMEHRRDLVLVQPLERDHVELDRETRRRRRIDPGEHQS